MAETLPIGEYLIRKELITPRTLAQVLKEQPAKRQRLISMLILRAELEIDDAATVLSEQSGYPAAYERHLEHRNTGVAKQLPGALCAQHAIIPIGKTAGGRLVVGARDPSPGLLAALEKATQLSIELAIVPSILIERLVRATFSLAVEPNPEWPAGQGSTVRARSVSALYADTQPPKPAGVPEAIPPPLAEPTPRTSPVQRAPTAKVMIPERNSGPIRAITDYDSAPILLDKPKHPSGQQIAIPEKETTKPRVAVQRDPAPSETPSPRMAVVNTPRTAPPSPPPARPLPSQQRPPTQPPAPSARPPTQPPPLPTRPPTQPPRASELDPPTQPPRAFELDPPTVRPQGVRPAAPPAMARTATEPVNPAVIARLRPPTEPPAPSSPPRRPTQPQTPIRNTGEEITRPAQPIDPDTGLPPQGVSRHVTPPAPAEGTRDRQQQPTRPAPNVPIPAEARQPKPSEPPYESVNVSTLAVEAGATASDPAVQIKPPVLPLEPKPLAERPALRPRTVSEMFGDLADETTAVEPSPPEPPVAVAPPPPEPPVRQSAPALPPSPRTSALPPPHAVPVRPPTEPTVTGGPPKPPAAPGTGSIDAVCKEIERAISRATADRVLITFAGSRFKAALLVMLVDGVARGARGQGPRLQAVQTVVLPIEAPSIIQVAHDTRELTRTAPPSPTQDRLADLLGSIEQLAVPILVDDNVVAVLIVGEAIELGVSDDELGKVVAAFATAYKRLYKSK